MIGVSEKTAEANPALTAWLDSAGLACAIFAASPRRLHGRNR